eukprot:13074772-Alexandrium_andersonii.AAC.1
MSPAAENWAWRQHPNWTADRQADRPTDRPTGRRADRPPGRPNRRSPSLQRKGGVHRPWVR